jgi:hypothetical protein
MEKKNKNGTSDVPKQKCHVSFLLVLNSPEYLERAGSADFMTGNSFF